MHSSDGLNNTLVSQGYILETAASMRMVDGMYIARTGEGVRSLRLHPCRLWVQWCLHPLEDLFQQTGTYFISFNQAQILSLLGWKVLSNFTK